MVFFNFLFFLSANALVAQFLMISAILLDELVPWTADGSWSFVGGRWRKQPGIRPCVCPLAPFFSDVSLDVSFYTIFLMGQWSRVLQCYCPLSAPLTSCCFLFCSYRADLVSVRTQIYLRYSIILIIDFRCHFGPPPCKSQVWYFGCFISWN